MTDSEDGPSDDCTACNGTGLKKLEGSPFRQDCPWCLGTGDQHV